MADRSERRLLGGVFFLALAVRLAALWAWESAGMNARLGYDPYVTYAKILLGWLPPSPIVAHPPLASFWAALVFAVVRAPSQLAFQLSNVLLSAAAVVIMARWAGRLLPPRAARWAALGLALDPLLVYFSPQLQSEPLFLFLLALFFLGLDCAGHPARRGDAFGLGVLGGLMTMTRVVTLFYPAFLVAGVLWVRRGSGRPAVAAWLLLCAGWALPPALWGVRNLAVHGQFIPTTTTGGWSLWEGFTLDREEVRRRPSDMKDEVARLGLLNERDLGAGGRHFIAKTANFVREQPLEAVRIVIGKGLLYWRPWVYDPYPPVVRVVSGVYFSALFALAIFGAVGLWGDPRWAPVWALFVNLSLLHAVLFTSVRYRVPLEPFLVCLAANGVARILSRRLAAGQPNPQQRP